MIAYTLIKKSRKWKEFLPGSATRFIPLFKKLFFQIDFSNGYGNLLFDCNLNANANMQVALTMSDTGVEMESGGSPFVQFFVDYEGYTRLQHFFSGVLPCISCVYRVQTENEKSQSRFLLKFI